MNHFVIALLAMNLGACLVFLFRGNFSWALIYFGAALIQTGSLWLTKN